jgi:hypothetical protein
MQYNTAPANTLFAKVSVKTKPYSTDPVSIRIVADVYANASSNKALYYTELPLQKHYPALHRICCVRFASSCKRSKCTNQNATQSIKNTCRLCIKTTSKNG